MPFESQETETPSKMKKTLKSLQLVYYAVYLVAFAAAFSGFKILGSGVRVDPLSADGISISSIMILYIMCSVPGSLWLFHKYTQKLLKEPDRNVRLSKYKTASVIRLITLGVALVGGIILYYVLHSSSMIFCAAIAFIGLIFCKPAEIRMVTDLKIEEPEETDEHDEHDGDSR